MACLCSQTNRIGIFYPMFWCQYKTIESKLIFKSLEFDGFKWYSSFSIHGFPVILTVVSVTTKKCSGREFSYFSSTFLSTAILLAPRSSSRRKRITPYCCFFSRKTSSPKSLSFVIRMRSCSLAIRITSLSFAPLISSQKLHHDVARLATAQLQVLCIHPQGTASVKPLLSEA